MGTLDQLPIVHFRTQHPVQPHRQLPRHGHLCQRTALPLGQSLICATHLWFMPHRTLRCFHQQPAQKRIPLLADQAELFKKRKLSPGTVTQRLAALRFFYIKTLKKTWSIAETPYPKRAFHLPSILSREEVARLIDAALTPYHRTLLMTLYATGVRRVELTHLKVSDIDRQSMEIHVQ